MKILLGFFSFLLLCLAVILYFYGDMERLSAFVEEYENTAHEKRAAVAEAYRQSWGVDKWSIASGVCVRTSIASGIAAFKSPKNKSSETN